MMKTSSSSLLELDLLEWQDLTPESTPALRGSSLGSRHARETAEQLASAGYLEVLELRDGLRVSSFHHVGRVRLGDVVVTIRPKLQSDTLLFLLRYAFGLRHLTLLSGTEQSARPHGFQDLLIQQLLAEVSELLARGLHRRYREVHEPLTVPRGRIDLQRIARNGGIFEAAIPSIHFPRLEDQILNQVLLGGLGLAAQLTNDLTLRMPLRRVAALFEETVSRIRLTREALRHANREMNRLTVSYQPALTLVTLLLESAGILLDDDPTTPAIPGFLFDMNRFFEALVSRFLRENLPGFQFKDQYQLRGMMSYAAEHNPQHRKAPTPRPDFVVSQNGRLVAMLDAKYRDIWNKKELPRNMLYQLAIYALSQGAGGQATILYPTEDATARDEVIDIHEPATRHHRAQVIVRPVLIPALVEVIQAKGMAGTRQRNAFASRLAFGGRAGL